MAAEGDGWVRFKPVERAMARRMERALEVPLTMEFTVADVAAALDEVKRLRADGVAATFNSMALLAAARGLAEIPEVAASVDFENWTKRVPESPNVGVAVASERGLVVPVVREVTNKQPSDLIAELDRIVKDVRAGAVEPDLFKGGDISITNMGSMEIYGGFPIPNLPEIAILGVSGSWDAPVVRDGEIVPSKLLRLTIAMDHRALDGVTAGRFLIIVKNALEDPASLVGA
jgi:pyruvate dehydrogenase E2 component (dihydrolipoamide acetyltransferase)